MAKSIVVLYNGAEERGWEGHGGDRDRDGDGAGTPGEMLGRAEPCSHLGINQCQGVVETSKGSGDSCERLKKILEVGWKMMEVGAEPMGVESPVGTGVSDGC